MGAKGLHLVKTKTFVTHFEKNDSRVTFYGCSYMDNGKEKLDFILNALERKIDGQL